ASLRARRRHKRVGYLLACLLPRLDDLTEKAGALRRLHVRRRLRGRGSTPVTRASGGGLGGLGQPRDFLIPASVVCVGDELFRHYRPLFAAAALPPGV